MGLISISAIIAPLPFRVRPVTKITETQAKTALLYLRENMGASGPVDMPPQLKETATGSVAVVMTVWLKGVRNKVVQVVSTPLKDALGRLLVVVQGYGDIPAESRLRLQLDFVMEEGWIPKGGILAGLAFVEGRDGLSGRIDGERVYLPPSELIRNQKYGGFKPLPKYDGKFRIGLDVDDTLRTIRHQGKRVGIRGSLADDIARFRSLTVVEGEDLVPRRLLKGTVERPPVTRSRVQAAVLAGAGYLARALQDRGMYRYHYNPLSDRDIKDSYNWPRHAGVTYSLALVGRILEKPELVAAAKRALATLKEQMVDSLDGSRCLMSRKKCYLGSSALALLAFAEYRIASKDSEFDDLSFRIARFLRSMQRQDGFFYHDWYPESGIDKERMKLYASQQAVFALARYGEAFGDKSAFDGARAGMDYLAGPYWDHFLGTFFFGQEHWTCLAAEEVYRVSPRREYADLCYGIGRHYDNITHKPGETPFPEDVGGMSITHIFTPHLGGTATAAEAMVSSVILGDATGRDTASIREQLAATFGFLIQGQITAHDTFWMKSPHFAVGGVLEMQSRPKVRIDNVQHAISAMVRGLQFLPEESPEALRDAEKAYEL